MLNHLERSSGSRNASLLRWLEWLCLISGAAALIWCGLTVADGEIAQRNARSALEAVMSIDEPLPAPTGKDVIEPRDPPVHVGSAIAALSIPRVQLSAMALHGSDAQTLQRGPGPREHTANPGSAGNIVIAGHRDSYFRPLRNIRLGDDIFLDTRDGRFHYQVTSFRVVGPRDVSVLAPTAEQLLTLITCYPFWVLGPAPDRFVVQAARVADHNSAPLEARSLSATESAAVPVRNAVLVSESIPKQVETPRDDESLVRLAVRRYLLTQRVYLVACAVSFDADRATADCESVVHGSSNDQPARTFSLERSNNAWAIKSIELR